MKGSLAIWHESTNDPVHEFRPHVQLHFNIWKDLPGGVDVFDFGVLIKELRTVSAFHILIPGDLNNYNIEDLSEVLCDDNTLRAVFNDTYMVGNHLSGESGGYEVLNEHRERMMYVLRVPNELLEITKIADQQNVVGTVLKIGPSILGAVNNLIGDSYLRLRIRLCGDLADLFGERILPRDSGFVSSFSAVDSVEFRVNERRNISSSLINSYTSMIYPQVSSINYFLIRHIGTDIIRSHEAFRRMRLLEPGLWDNYLASLRIGNIRANQFVIYQWRADMSANKEIDGFIALSFFKRAFSVIFWYVLIAIIVGSIGSTISSLLLFFALSYFNKSSWITSVLIYVSVSALLTTLLYVVVRLVEHRAKKV